MQTNQRFGKVAVDTAVKVSNIDTMMESIQELMATDQSQLKKGFTDEIIELRVQAATAHAEVEYMKQTVARTAPEAHELVVKTEKFRIEAEQFKRELARAQETILGSQQGEKKAQKMQEMYLKQSEEVAQLQTMIIGLKATLRHDWLALILKYVQKEVKMRNQS